MPVLMRHAVIGRPVRAGMRMRVIMQGITVSMLMGVDNDLPAAAAAHAVLATDLAGSPTFRTFIIIFHEFLPGCSVTLPSP
jgi:hypothetical protein